MRTDEMPDGRAHSKPSHARQSGARYMKRRGRAYGPHRYAGVRMRVARFAAAAVMRRGQGGELIVGNGASEVERKSYAHTR